MSAVQLEFNLDDADEYDIRLSCMQKQLDAMNESMGKVRRKIFAEVGELKKLVMVLQDDNEMLKNRLNVLQNHNTEWVYTQNQLLFSIKEK